MRRTVFISGIIALVASLLAALLLPPGGDYPAAEFRTWLFEHYGFSNWNPYWYGGHEILGYSVLLPPLGSVFDVQTVLIVSTAISAVMFSDLACRHFGGFGQLSSYWLALALSTNVLIGRAAFSLGVLFGLFALVLWQHRYNKAAIVLAVICPLGSPVAGAFLALCGTAVWLADPRSRRARVGIYIAITSLLTTAVMGIVFSGGGTQPFSTDYFLTVLGVCLLALLTLTPDQPVLRIGFTLYAISTVLTFLVPNPMGNNIVRLAVIFAGPVLLSAWRQDGVNGAPIGKILARRSSRYALGGMVIASLLYTQIDPADDVIVDSSSDSSIYAGFYVPLLSKIPPAAPNQKVEVVPTLNHWEALYAAKRFKLIRGWERQLDTERNQIFYDGTLNNENYCGWLSANRVTHVALPDTRLDYASIQERKIIQSDTVCLKLIWRSSDWQLYRVNHSGHK